MTVHVFNVDDAVKYGIEKAVILQNMRFWLDKNKANGANLHDDYYWTYNSVEAFSELFPYFSKGIIQRLLKSMEKEGLLLAGNYNKKGYDRTKWYSMPEYRAVAIDTSHSPELVNGVINNDEPIHQIQQVHSPELTNGFTRIDGPIPDINTDIKPDINTDIDTKKKSSKKAVKKLTDYPNDFKPTDKQVDKMNEYGINIPLFLDTFESGVKAKGLQYKCWTSAFTTWINNEIKFNKLVPVPAQEEYKPAFNGWNDRNPDYKPSSQQPDVYHPSQAEFQPSESVTYVPAIGDPNWRWTEPLPGMSIIETDRYIKDHKRKGENPNRAYQRLLAEMQGETA